MSISYTPLSKFCSTSLPSSSTIELIKSNYTCFLKKPTNMMPDQIQTVHKAKDIRELQLGL